MLALRANAILAASTRAKRAATVRERCLHRGTAPSRSRLVSGGSIVSGAIDCLECMGALVRMGANGIQ
jgi:hypothetical protein